MLVTIMDFYNNIFESQLHHLYVISKVYLMSGGYCNTGITSETHFTRKSSEISFVNKIVVQSFWNASLHMRRIIDAARCKEFTQVLSSVNYCYVVVIADLINP